MTWKTDDRTSIRKIGDFAKLRVIDFGDTGIGGQLILVKSPRVGGDSVDEVKRKVEIETVKMAEYIINSILPTCSGCERDMGGHQFINNDAIWMNDIFVWKEISKGVWICPDCLDNSEEE